MSIIIPISFSIFTFIYWFVWHQGWLGGWGRTGVPIWVTLLSFIGAVATWAIFLYSHLTWTP